MPSRTLAKRLKHIPSFLVLDMLRDAHRREANGATIHHLEAGQPCFPPPAAVLDAVATALPHETFGYTEAKGMVALRERIAAQYQDQYNVLVDPAQILLTTGSSGAFILALLAAFDSGAKVGVPVPGYPAYRNILLALDMEPVPIRLNPAHGYRLSVADLQQAGRLDGLMLASPANPTGAMLRPKQLQAIADYCRIHNTRIISDELYHGITFDTVAEQTMLAYDRHAIVVNSFSKYYAMTGWRLGWMIVPQRMVAAAESLMQSLFIAAPTISQIAGLAALDCRQTLDGYVAHYAKNRTLLLHTLRTAGFQHISPADGAFYVYADASHLTHDSLAWCQNFLAQHNIAVTAGVDFDPWQGNTTMRFSFSAEKQAITALGQALQH